MKSNFMKEFVALLVLVAVTPCLMAPGWTPCGACDANLVPQDLWMEPEGTGSQVFLWVENQGDAASEGAWVDLFVNLSAPPDRGDPSDRRAWCRGLDPGDAELVTFYLQQPPGQLEWLDVIADSTDVVAELDEDDNLAALRIPAPP